MKKLLDRIFIDGLGGMAQGLFATLIIGTIIQQIGLFMGGGTGDLIYELGKIAAGLTGAGIGVGVARKLEAGHLVIVSVHLPGKSYPDRFLWMEIWFWQGRESR